jgi:hypothetical protein
MRLLVEIKMFLCYYFNMVVFHKQPSKVGDFSQQRKGRVVVKNFLEMSQISFRIAMAKRK